MIKKTLKRCVQWIMSDHIEHIRQNTAVPKSNHYHKVLHGNSMNFHMYAAVGGTVIEAKIYNEKLDQNESRMYVIPEGQNFEKTLSEIVTLERLKS
jgi:hypothetical protein